MSSGNAAPASVGQTVLNLTDCDREPIQFVGSVQPLGFLIVVTSDWMVARASVNAPAFLGRSLDELLGSRLADILSEDALHSIRNRLSMILGESTVERAFGIQLQHGGPIYDLALHFVGSNIVLEAEPSEAPGTLNAGMLVRSMIERLQQREKYSEFMREAARQVRVLTGFDRVMVYRFQSDGAGEVVAESLRARLDPFMGLRFPGSDIPVQARALYERNLLRLIADVDAVPARIEPLLDGIGQPLDMTMSVLRAVSPVHLQYLRNMNVRASMSISILRGGKLWGLIACHHMEPRVIGFERRTTAELFVQMFSLLLERRERDDEIEQGQRARLLHDQLVGIMATERPSTESVASLAEQMGKLIPHDGVGIWADGIATLKGSTPTSVEFEALARILNRQAASRILATSNIGALHAQAAPYAEHAAGLLAIPISRMPRDYVVFFRREVARTVTWAGNPDKPVEQVEGSTRLSPRQSFEAWREIVRGQSTPWTNVELAIAEEMRIALLEVFLRHADALVDERRAEATKQDLLIAELNHRVRNILGLVNGLVSQSGATAENIEGFRAVLGGRVQSLARAHDQITTDNWGPASLNRLVATEADAYLGGRPDCITIEGPALLLSPRAFTTVALLVHEMMTNSAKYGAIGSSDGCAAIQWTLDAGEDCIIDWLETGGPLVTPPAQRGFGSTIIERSIQHDLKGEAEIDYLPSGVRARFVIPAEFVSRGEDLHATPKLRITADDTARLTGPVLLVEDKMIIALDAEAILLGLGASRVDIAGNTADALRLIDFTPPSLAVLDVNIGSETSFAIAHRLLELGVPIVFATGYGVEIAAPPGCEAVPVVTKPYTAAAIARAVASAMAD